MAISDFTGKNIQDTYQRVVQTDNTNRLADGEGNIFIPISASHAISASYAVSASHEITLEISSSYAQTASMASDNFIIQGHITASGNISASNQIFANALHVDQSVLIAGQRIVYDPTGDNIKIEDSGLWVEGGHITASGDISASGELIGIINGGTF